MGIMPRDAMHWEEPSLFDPIYRAGTALWFAMFLFYQGGLPRWADWAALAFAAVACVWVCLQSIRWFEDRKRQRLADADREAVAAIRRIGSTYSNIYTVAQIAEQAGIDEALCEKALLVLEEQGFAKRAPGNLWQLGMRH